MNPNGAIVGCGRYPYWLGQIRPFFNSDITIPVLFYAVPEENPSCYPTVFCDRFWDDREGWTNVGVGTVSKSLTVLRNPGSLPVAGPIAGDPDWYVNGIDYDLWLAGGYPSTAACWQPIPAVACLCFDVGVEAEAGELDQVLACLCMDVTATASGLAPSAVTACLCMDVTATASGLAPSAVTACLCMDVTALQNPGNSVQSCLCLHVSTSQS